MLKEEANLEPSAGCRDSVFRPTALPDHALEKLGAHQRLELLFLIRRQIGGLRRDLFALDEVFQRLIECTGIRECTLR